MLKIQNDTGLTLQLPADQRLTVEINSTIFDTDDVIRGSYSYPFKFGLTENNCQFIENGHLPEMNQIPELPVKVTTGMHSFTAVLTFKTSGLYADGSLLIDLGEIAEKIRNTPLREFVTETFNVGLVDSQATPSMKQLATADPNRYPIVFPPFRDNNIVEETFLPYAKRQRPLIINEYHRAQGKYTPSYMSDGIQIYVPMIYLCWLLNYICNKIGLKAEGSLFSDPNLNNIIIFNTQSVPGADAGTGEYSVMLSRHLPDMTISEFLKSIRAYFGLSIDINQTSRKALFNTYSALKKKNEYQDLSNTLVPGTVGVEAAGAGGYIVQQYAEDNGQLMFEEYDQASSLWWFKELPSISSYTVGTGQAEIETKAGTIAMSIQRKDDSGDASIAFYPASFLGGNLADPYFKESQNYSPYIDPEKPDEIPKPVNEFRLLFLAYAGMKPDRVNNVYPYATSLSYDAKYNVFSKISLLPGEPDSLWYKYQKPYYEFLSFAVRNTAVLRMTTSQLNSISPSIPIGIKTLQYVLVKYILEKLTYELPAEDGFVLVKFEGRHLLTKVANSVDALADGKPVYWVAGKITNLVTSNVGDHTEHHGNVVLYAYADGLFTTPITPGSGSFWVKIKKGTYQVQPNGKYTTVYTYDEVLMNGSSVVLETNIHLSSFKTSGWTYRRTWTIQGSPFYRVR